MQAWAHTQKKSGKETRIQETKFQGATRNEHMKVRKEEERRYEKNIVEKFKEQPKYLHYYT